MTEAKMNPETYNEEKKAGKKKRSSSGRFFILAGLLCILAAAGLCGYNYWDDQRAGEASEEITEILIKKVEENTASKTINLAVPGHTQPYRDMATEEVDGYLYIGTIESPTLGMTLPVMQDWDLNWLKKSPCRYTGSYYTNDLVICAHNYRKHFSPFRRLSPGEEIIFRTVDGQVLHYIITNVETVKDTDIESMIANDQNSDSTNHWDLTLFTCTVGGQARWAIRCERTDTAVSPQASAG